MKMFKRWLDGQRSGRAKHVKAAASPLLLALEPRVVYDASVAATVAQPHGPQAEHVDVHRSSETAISVATPSQAAPARQAETTPGAPPAGRHDPVGAGRVGQDADAAARTGVVDAASTTPSNQVVFIDPSVANYQTLIAGLPAGTQHVVLDGNTDGLAQIAQYLQTHHGVDSISLISHGSDNAVQVGSTWLTTGDIAGYQTQLAQIGAAMKAGGDFLIYGCDVAQRADGQALVQQIASITHLNVAASIDATGATALGGNWTLEYQVGTVHTALNESAGALARFDELLGVTTETYDDAANNNFAAVGQSQFTLDGIVYTLDQPTNSYAYNDSNAPNGPTDITEGPTDGVLEVNADGASTVRNLTISLANGHTFSLQSFDLSSFNGDLYIQANYANGSKSAMIQLATATVGGFSGPVSNTNQLGTAFNNIISFSLIDQNDSGAFEPSLDNLAYIDSGPSLTASSGSAAWVSSDNGTGGTPVAVDAGITLSDGTTPTAANSATIKITNVQSGDQLGFTNQNGITGSYNASTGTLTLSSASAQSLATWQTALESVTYYSTLTSPTLSTTARTVSFTFNDGATVSSAVTRNVTITATDQTPLVTEGGAASTSYIAGTAAVAIDTNLHVSDADTPKLTSGTVAIASGYASGDTLAFSNTSVSLYGDITGSYNSSSHQLTLTSVSNNATVAQWQNAFEAVTFSSATNTTGGTRDITFAVSDGTKTSALLHHGVVVSAGPTVSTDTGSAQFVSGDNATSTPVAIDPGILIADGSSTTLASATVAITGNFQANHDELVFVGNPATMGNISGVYDSSTGMLTLTAGGGASLLQWQNALASVRFTNDLVVPSNATRTVSFQVNDGTLTSATATRTVAVTATDQTPLLGGGGNTVAFVAGDNAASTPVAVNSGIVLSDLDNTTLASAVVHIGAGFHAGEDVLGFVNTNTGLYGNIVASYNAATGTLTMTSAGAIATLAQWQAALRSVTYTDTAITPNTATRSIGFTVSDGSKTSTAATSTVTVADTDQTPLISGSSGSVTFTQGDNVPATPIVIDSGITVSDLDNATLTQANVVIAGGYDSNGDTLLFTNDGATMGNITGTYANGVLVLTSSNGSATLAQWQAALRSIRFTDSAATPASTQRIIDFTITDGVKVSANFQRTLDVVLTDQTPIVTDSGGATHFTSGDNAPSTPVVVDPGVTLTDTDSPTMVSAVVAITGNYQSGEDVLAIGSGAFGDIQAHFDASTGTLTLTSAGASTAAQWQAALRSVTYTDTAVLPNTANRTISFSVNDGTKSSIGLSKVVVLDATHQTPVLGASGSGITYLPGQSATTIDSGITLTDRNVGGASLVSLTLTARITSGQQNNDVLSVDLSPSALTNGMSVTYDSGNGTLTITSTGGTLAQWQTVLDNLQFSTDANAALGTRTISVTISDGVKTSAPIDYSVDVISSAPALATSSTGNASFVAGDNTSATPVAVDPGLTVADPLGDVVDSATVAITGNLHSGEDQLSFVNDGLTMGDITGNYNALTGVLTLTSAGSSATLAQWQAALRSVTYTDTLVTPSVATRTVSFSLNAGSQFSNVITRDVAVTATDQTPLLSSSSTGSAAFVAGDNAASTPVAIDTGIAVSDLDNPTLSSATVQIGAGFHAGEDVLGFVNDGATMGNITATYDAIHGTLTLSSANSSATQLQWQNALRAVTYTDTAITPTTASRSISFTVSDGTKSSLALSRTVTVADTDQTPVISTSSTRPTIFVSGDNAASTPVAVDGGIVLGDLDNTTLASATVQIGAGFHAGEDVLGFVNDGATMGNITASYDAATGALTLASSGASATLAQWQAALRSISYLDTALSPNQATRSIDFSVNDGSKTSAVYSREVTVIATDQAPLISTSNIGSVVFVVGDNAASTPVAVDNGISLADADNATLASATVQIGTGFHAGEDVLGFVNDGATMGNITASYDAATGALTLASSGASATLAQWQAALRAVTYTDTAITPDTATRSIGFIVNDGVKNSTALTRTVAVADTDQTPIASTTSTGPVTFVAGDNAPSTPVAVDTGILLADADNATLASATVQIGTGFHAGEDVLGFVNDGVTMGNITASYDAATGTLALSSQGSTATLAQWQAALRAVTYTDAAVTPDTATRSIGFIVNDGVKNSTALTRTVRVADTDQTPIVTSSSSGPTAFVSADGTGSTPVAVDVGIVLSDLDNATLASATVQIGTGFHAGEDVLGFINDGATMGNITASYDAATGTLALSSQGSTATLAQWQAALRAVTYTDTAVTPDTATRSIGFTVNDGSRTSAALAREVAVSATVQTPQLSADTTTLNYTADGKAGSAILVGSGVVLIDRNPVAPTAATVALTGPFDPQLDQLSLTTSPATGDIVASYDAARGVLTLRSTSGTAAAAQWQAALAAVTYSHGRVEHTDSTLQVQFTVSQGVKTSDPLVRQLQIHGVAQAVGTPILPWAPQVRPTDTDTWSSPYDRLGAFDSLGQPVDAPAILLQGPSSPRIGALASPATITFSTADALAGPIGHTFVPRVDSIVPAALDSTLADARLLPPFEVHLQEAAGTAFALDIGSLLRPSDGTARGPASVTLALTDGSPLPAWLSYDATGQRLHGHPPAGVREVRVLVLLRDVTGHTTVREVDVRFDAKGGTSPAQRPVSQPQAAVPHRPAAKASLSEQLRHAQALLHVASAGVVSTDAHGATAPVGRPS